MATADVYKARILAFVEGKDPMEVQRQTPAALAQLISGVSDNKLRQRPDPAKWSIGEVIAHLAEAEIVNSWRYRQMVEQMAARSRLTTRICGTRWAITLRARQPIRYNSFACFAKTICACSIASLPSSGSVTACTPNAAA